ncbi:LexA family transcriptional regulator [Helicobacter muridarum]|uniref:HTH-type transcriptional regulator immR n=2 Tax=Helicobacter muridarum TaxID=216 RepID=A0A377PUA9_9HELI|nr:XRE family transcriptional regulator [Helicobacter muridarum]TLE01193.1 LexA family transcriptional regulator [Helicobacter muridarum]STQ86069.1 HTH-type transcriptional regulator immR [Helicobacter muridarum]
MNIHKKIREIRGELTQEEFASRLNINSRTLQNYEYGKTSPTADFLQKISQEFNIATSYFFDDEIPKSPQNRFLSDSLVIPKSQNKGFLSQNNSQSNDTIQIPIYDVYASAGQRLINDENIESYVGIDKSFLHRNFGLTSFVDLSIIHARGDSMLPTIPPNCKLLVQSKASLEKGIPREEQICVTRIDDELYIKRLQKRPKYKLISDNKSYDDIILEGENYEILGVVVGLFQKL